MKPECSAIMFYALLVNLLLYLKKKKKNGDYLNELIP